MYAELSETLPSQFSHLCFRIPEPQDRVSDSQDNKPKCQDCWAQFSTLRFLPRMTMNQIQDLQET